MEADSAQAVAESLERTGKLPITVREQRMRGRSLDELTRSFRRVRTDELTLFTRELATVLRAGIPILTSLRILEEQTKSELLRESVASVAQDVQGGVALSDALSRFPRVFPGLYVTTIRAGESSGSLPEVLERLAALLEQEQSTRQEVKAALRYPLIVVITLCIAFLVITTVVMPRFVDMYASFNIQLPLPTRAMIGLNTILRDYWFLVLAGIAGAAAGWAWYVRTDRGRYRLDAIKLRLPVLGSLFLQAVLSRFSHMFETLNRSGLPIMDTLRIVTNTVGNAVVAREMERVLQGVEKGHGVSASLRQTTLFPPLVVQLIALGEEAGALDDMLQEISRHYDRELAYGTKRLTSLIEPVLTVGLGLIVLFMALAVYLPWWSRIGAIQGR
jgi:type IV pilus assembly protein PilC